METKMNRKFGNKKPRNVLTVFASLVVAIGLAACEPAYPDAEGTIEVSASIHPEDYNTLEYFSFEWDDAQYDFETFELSDLDADNLYIHGESIKLYNVEFPYGYSTFGSMGSSDTRRFAVIALLSDVPRFTAFGVDFVPPNPGDAWGITLFNAPECSPFFGKNEYCGTKHGVDVVIDRIVPGIEDGQ